jgi:hypothetical protein
MPVWRCPHCATPQAEASRCWVCRRSTTSCATCRHFRRGVANGLGLCGLDPRHTALRGTEMRACWSGDETPGEASLPEASRPEAGARAAGTGRDVTRRRWEEQGRRPRTFVPVDEVVATREPAPRASQDPSPGIPARLPAPGTGWSLWGEPDA